MKIIRIFALVEESLYSVMYGNEIHHEFERLFETWNDAEYLEQFFFEQREDLERPFWGHISVEQAVIKTKRDARILETKIIQIAKTGKTDNYETLSTLFKPLHNEPDWLDPFEKSKVYGLLRPSWIRMYAVRLDTNLFLISGGAIKLTRKMDKPHLQKELEKLETTRTFCKVNFNAALGYFEI